MDGRAAKSGEEIRCYYKRGSYVEDKLFLNEGRYLVWEIPKQSENIITLGLVETHPAQWVSLFRSSVLLLEFMFRQ